MIKQTFKIPIYDRILVLVIIDEFNNAFKEFKIPLDGEDYSYTHGLALSKDGYKYMIMLHPKTRHSIIVHEIIHVTHMILRDVGIKEDYNNDEAETYLADYLVEVIYKALDKYKVEINI
jgi:hypothetical protein